MKHRRHADPGAQMLGIGGNGQHGLRRRFEQKARRLPPCSARRRRRSLRAAREHDVVVGFRYAI